MATHISFRRVLSASNDEGLTLGALRQLVRQANSCSLSDDSRVLAPPSVFALGQGSSRPVTRLEIEEG